MFDGYFGIIPLLFFLLVDQVKSSIEKMVKINTLYFMKSACLWLKWCFPFNFIPNDNKRLVGI